MRVPASSANLGPGLRLHGGGDRAGARARGARRRGASPSTASWRSRRAREPVRARLRALHPADGFTLHDPLADPALGRARLERRGDRRGARGRRHLFELDADLLGARDRARGSPDNVAAALHGGFVICADGARDALRAADRARGARGRARSEAVRTRAARAALPAQVPLADAVFNVAHGALLTLGLARGDWELLARGLRTACTSAARAPLPALLRAGRGGARELGALGATISGAGPTVLVWCFYEQTGAVARGARGASRGLGERAARPVRGAGRLRRGALSERPRRARAAPSRPPSRSSSSPASAR